MFLVSKFDTIKSFSYDRILALKIYRAQIDSMFMYIIPVA